ncbi:MAG: V-type ATP synthase subunit E family protein [Candidatus Omnitrophica bacterium]|nr:V-type ATP synthase subunit E family protein [Candidatus Omnitrophota bacterium]
MAEDIQGLLKKIQEEGIKKAEEKAEQIEKEARKRAEEILSQAKEEAERLIKEAKEKISQEQSHTQTLLQQAARDLLLTLKKEINSLLQKIISQEIDTSLNAEELGRIISAIIKEYKGETPEIVVLLKKEEAENLERHFFNRLKEEIKKGIVIKPSEEVSGGFLISYDGGKSYFDFSVQALAEYLGNYLKPKLKDLLNETFKG